jgi:hypothetical protein
MKTIAVADQKGGVVIREKEPRVRTIMSAF